MEVRLTYNDEHGSCVTFNDVNNITQYNDEIVLHFAPYSTYVKMHDKEHCIIYRCRLKHLKVLLD